MRRINLACAFLAAFLASAGRLPPLPSNVVPDERTATAIAYAVLVPVYGEEQVKSEEALVASLKGTRWVVTGTPPGSATQLWVGGTVEVEISAKDGRILRISHGR